MWNRFRNMQGKDFDMNSPNFSSYQYYGLGWIGKITFRCTCTRKLMIAFPMKKMDENIYVRQFFKQRRATYFKQDIQKGMIN